MPTFKCQSCDKTFFFKSRFFKHLSSISHIRFSKGTQVPLGTLLPTNGQSILYKIDYIGNRTIILQNQLNIV